MGFRGSFVGLGKYCEDIFLNRFSTELPLKPFLFLFQSFLIGDSPPPAVKT